MEQRNIEYTTVDINSIEAHPKNVRQGDIGAISESLKAHGQYRPIVVDKRTNRILAGNHTWKAAKALGWQQISAGFIETKDDDEALRILLADNRTTDLASYDDTELANLLKQLAETDEGLLGTAFDGDDLDNLINNQNQTYENNEMILLEKYEVVIECANENEQTELLARFQNEGLIVRALII